MNGILSRSRNCKWSFYFFFDFSIENVLQLTFNFFSNSTLHVYKSWPIMVITEQSFTRSRTWSLAGDSMLSRIPGKDDHWSGVRTEILKKNVYLKKISFTFNRHSGENQKLRLGIMDRSWVEYCVKSVCRTGRLAADAAQHKKYNNNRWSRFPSTTPHYTTTTHHGVVNVNPGRLNYF